MLKKIIAALVALLAATAFAAVDANKATQAELEAVKGIGPAISAKIIDERKKGHFKDWNDLVVRVQGVGEKNAEKLSEGGLTVNGKAYSGVTPAATTSKAAPAATAAPAKPASSSPRVVEATKATAAKAASATVAAGKRVKEDAKEQKDAVKENVADAKTKRAEKKAEKEAKKAEKAEAKAAAASAAKK